MTLIRGGPAGPDGSGGAYPNEVETDRSAWWHALGGRQGVLKGFAHSGVAGQMALDFTPGAALVGERDATGVASLDRGYLVWADSTTRVSFGTASASDRNDAVVAAFVDVEDGPVGTGGLDVGPHIVVVPGVSGTTTPRTDTQINDYLGRGGWVRLLDVPIASTDTEINVANVVVKAARTVPQFRATYSTSQNFVHNITTTRTLTGIAGTPNFAASGDDVVYSGPAGRFHLEFATSFAQNPDGFRQLQVLHNGGTARLITQMSSSATGAHLAASCPLDLKDGDTLTIQARQGSGVDLAAASGGTEGNTLTGILVGPPLA